MTANVQHPTRGQRSSDGRHAAWLIVLIIGGTIFLAVAAMTTALVRDSGPRSLMFEDIGDFILSNAIAAFVGLSASAVAVVPCFVLLHRKPLRASALFIFAPTLLAVELYVLFPPILWKELYPLPSAVVALIVMLALAVVARFSLRDDPRFCPAHLCPQCAYDISGSASPGCPECGWGRDAS